ncbi:undecaprenyl-diphosphatase [Parvibaculum sp. MBR-TMA-1.3b-4.2]|jgi:undecaprenyl-diphosphatase
MAIGEDVLEGEHISYDRELLLWLRVPGHLNEMIGPAWLEQAFRDVTSLGSYTALTMVVAISVGYLLVAARYRTALIAASSVSLGALLERELKLSFARLRPDLVPHLVEVHTLSFPSGHAMLSAITYLTLGSLLASAEPERGLRIFILTVGLSLTLLVGTSRVFLGVHWPSDVLAGWAAGSLWALAFWVFAIWAARPASSPPETN